VGGIASPFLTSALKEREWSASSPGRFAPEENSGTSLIAVCVGFEIGCCGKKRNIFALP
jgi:hypothetical protein